MFTTLRKSFLTAILACCSTSVFAVPLVDWTISGAGTTNATEITAGEWDLDYSLSGTSVWSTQTWTATAVATEAGDYTFDWNYSGFHAFYNVTAFLNSYDSDGSSTVYSGGPKHCCTSPSAGFNESGSIVFTGLSVGETFGFTFGGRNSDRDTRLMGTLNLTQASVPEPSSMLLFGLGVMGLFIARRRQK